MKATVRRTIEMSKRVLSFSNAYPDPSQGYAAAVARLAKALAEADLLADLQRDGINAYRASTGVKRSLRRKIRRTGLYHLARVAESASAEAPELAQKFRLTKEAVPYLAFRTVARGMLAEGRNQKELLVRHGLLESVLDTLSANLDKFDQAVEQGIEARRTHVGASAELDVLDEELRQVVRVLDGTNRSRFAEVPDSLAQWESASNVIGPPRSGGGRANGRTGGASGGQSVSRSDGQATSPPTSGGDITPAA